MCLRASSPSLALSLRGRFLTEAAEAALAAAIVANMQHGACPSVNSALPLKLDAYAARVLSPTDDEAATVAATAADSFGAKFGLQFG